jgi:hypothetical protein
MVQPIAAESGPSISISIIASAYSLRLMTVTTA